LNEAQQAFANSWVGTLLAVPTSLGLTDRRSLKVAKETWAAGPILRDGAPLRVGPLALYRAGGGNVAPSAAAVIELARHHDKTVICYSNPGDPRSNKLREVTHVDGVPLPPELRGKVYAIGDPENRNFYHWAQGSDHFIEQLQEIHRNRALLGVDVLESRATVVGHSEGCSDAVLTRKRLEEAGLSKVFGSLITLSSILRGEPGAYRAMCMAMMGPLSALGAAPDLQALIDDTEPSRTARWFPEEDAKYVDLALAGEIGPPAKMSMIPLVRLALGQRVFEGLNDILPMMRWAASAGEALQSLVDPSALSLVTLFNALRGGYLHSDGLVPTESTRFGKRCEVVPQPEDHLGMLTDPAVIRYALQLLTESRD
jgi:hypothetical protein